MFDELNNTNANVENVFRIEHRLDLLKPFPSDRSVLRPASRLNTLVLRPDGAPVMLPTRFPPKVEAGK